MAQVFDLSCLQSLVNYSFANIARVKKELNLDESINSLDFFCIAILKFDNQKNLKYAVEILNKILRNSDAFFNEGNNFIYLVLPGTDESGATYILEDFREFLGNTFKYKVLELKQDNTKDLGKILFDLKKIL
ncbi:MAG: hypothetical protein ACPLW6_02795 [Desulfurella sp.]|uniref:GGDEF domain-containing protein, diguanylate cyclase (C-di-GMP synthetase) or its enzymatically inactive variants n=1 Tax=Desulfurella multipotens TaxID=79269 RepID=A0A1G6QE23_9BACT|nr:MULTISPECIES: hypothetical protein [Desulfurella]AHF97731.1 hypothetical protein DESACE_01510 [Desulfurella acetivorans A63]HEX13507.1 hypothetical protein [Desulfurella acetivorans]PMP68952.1 MAG: hypothetical protein C0192_01035 [Desulfurella multipotens]PMP90701.1 MAG: hypothetical protein C0173_04170 [Desulfurella sp.]SDC90174.1 hypothetical protein SAMN05660835_01559 [Desulfurella multipotens]